MATVITSASLGLYHSSLTQTGLNNGLSQLGQQGNQVYVNANTGNLVVQQRDELLKATGIDQSLIRTYNSQGLLSDDNGDNWQLNVHQKVKTTTLTGTINTTGSTIVKTHGDGSEQTYTYKGSLGHYTSTNGAGSHDTLSYNAATDEWTWTDGTSAITETYDGTTGLITRHQDSDSHITDYSYTANLLTQISSTIDGKIQTTQFIYNGNNLEQIKTISDGIEQTRVRYGYDSENRLSIVTVDLTPEDNSIVDGETYITTYTYDGTSERIASITSGDGTSVNFTYIQDNGDYKVATMTDGEGKLTTYSYNGSDTSITDALGHTTVYGYDLNGQLLSMASPDLGQGPIVSYYGYDNEGNLTSITDGNGNETQRQFDNGNLILEQDALGNTASYTYSASNQLLTQTTYSVVDSNISNTINEASGAQTSRYVYDNEDHLRFVVSSEGRVSENRYDTNGNLISSHTYFADNYYDISGLSVTDSLTESQLETWVNTTADKSQSSLTQYSYDFRGNIESSTTYQDIDSNGQGVGVGATTTYVYDQAGQLRQTIDANGTATTGDTTDGITEYTYDGLGRLLTTTNALDQQTTIAYDDAGNRVTTTLENGLATTQAFDNRGLLVSTSQTAGLQGYGTTTNEYDDAGRLASTTDALGHKTYFLYDDADRLSLTVDAQGSVSQLVYDNAGNIIQTTTYKIQLNATQIASLTSDNDSIDLVSLADSEDRHSYTVYDNANRPVLTIDAGNFVTKVIYDGEGQIVESIAYNDAITVPTQRTIANIEAAISTDSRDRHSYNQYSADGQLTRTLDGEGYLTEFNYDAGGRLIETVRYANSTTDINTTPATSSDDQHSHILYNDQSQVIAEIDAEGYLTEYSYDLNGNVTEQIRYANKAATYTGIENLVSIRPAAAGNDAITLTAYDQLNRAQTITAQTHSQDRVIQTETTYSYDNVGNVTQTDYRSGDATLLRTTQTEYDDKGRITRSLSANGSAALEQWKADNPSAIPAEIEAQTDIVWAAYSTQYTYNNLDQVIRTVDAIGNLSFYYYDELGRQTYQVNGNGEVTQTEYTTFGQTEFRTTYVGKIDLTGLEGGVVTSALTNRINAIADNNQDSTVSREYDVRGLVSRVIDANSRTTDTNYNAFGEVTNISQQRNGAHQTTNTYTATTLSYDKVGQLTRTVQDNGGLNRTISNDYDAFGRITQSTDANNNITQYSYDRLGRVVTTTNALNNNQVQTYDAFGRVLTQTDGNGHTVTTTYDDTNNSVTILTAEGISTTTFQNEFGETVLVRDGNSHETSYDYDANGNLINVTDGAGNETSTEYDEINQVVEVRDGNGIITTFTYDAVGRTLTRAVDSELYRGEEEGEEYEVEVEERELLNLITSYDYDGQGRTVSITDANGIVTTSEYDKAGNILATVVDPTGLNIRTEYSYDAQGNTLSITEAAGTVDARTTIYNYDGLGRRIETIQDDGGLNLTTHYQYDDNDNVIKVIEAVGKTEERTTQYIYDDVNQQRFHIDAQGYITESQYDANGNVISSTRYITASTGLSATPTETELENFAQANSNSNDQTTYSTYNKDSQLTYFVDAKGAVTQYNYDGNGNVVKTVNYANTINPQALDFTAETINSDIEAVIVISQATIPNLITLDIDTEAATLHNNPIQPYGYIAGATQEVFGGANSAVSATTTNQIDVNPASSAGTLSSNAATFNAAVTSTGVNYKTKVYQGTDACSQPIYHAVDNTRTDDTEVNLSWDVNEAVLAGEELKVVLNGLSWEGVTASHDTTVSSSAGSVSITTGNNLGQYNFTTPAHDLGPTTTNNTHVPAATYTSNSTGIVDLTSISVYRVTPSGDELLSTHAIESGNAAISVNGLGFAGQPADAEMMSLTYWDNNDPTVISQKTVAVSGGEANILADEFAEGDFSYSAAFINDLGQVVNLVTGGFTKDSNGISNTSIVKSDYLEEHMDTSFSWSSDLAPDSATGIEFSYRLAGSTHAWTNLVVDGSDPGQHSVLFDHSTSGTYEYVITYKDSAGEVLKTAKAEYTVDGAGSSTHDLYQADVVQGSQISGYISNADAVNIDYIESTVYLAGTTTQVGASALTYPVLQGNSNVNINVAAGATLADDGEYDIKLVKHYKDSTSSEETFYYEVGQQSYAGRQSVFTWSNTLQPAGTTAHFFYSLSGSQSEAEIIPILNAATGEYQVTVDDLSGTYNYRIEYQNIAGNPVSYMNNHFGVHDNNDDSQVTTELTSLYEPVAGDQVNRTVYDAANRAVYIIDAEGYVTHYQYDGNDNVTESVKYVDAIDTRNLATNVDIQTIANMVSPPIMFDIETEDGGTLLYRDPIQPFGYSTSAYNETYSIVPGTVSVNSTVESETNPATQSGSLGTVINSFNITASTSDVNYKTSVQTGVDASDNPIYQPVDNYREDDSSVEINWDASDPSLAGHQIRFVLEGLSWEGETVTQVASAAAETGSATIETGNNLGEYNFTTPAYATQNGGQVAAKTYTSHSTGIVDLSKVSVYRVNVHDEVLLTSYDVNNTGAAIYANGLSFSGQSPDAAIMQLTYWDVNTPLETTQKAVVVNGGDADILATEFSDGSYQYEAAFLDVNGNLVNHVSGGFAKSGATVSNTSITLTTTLSQYTDTEISWPTSIAPADTSEIEFNYRLSGSNDEWTALDVTDNGAGQNSVFFGYSPDGVYDYVINYKNSDGVVLKTTADQYTINGAGSNQHTADFGEYAISPSTGSALTGYISDSDAASIDYIEANVFLAGTETQIGTTAFTYPALHSNSNVPLNLSVGAELASDGQYEIQVIKHYNDETEIVEFIYHEVGQQSYTGRDTSISWDAENQPENTSTHFYFAPLGSGDFTELAVTFNSQTGKYSVNTEDLFGDYDYRVEYHGLNGAVVSSVASIFTVTSDDDSQVDGVLGTGNTAAEQHTAFYYDAANRLVSETLGVGTAEQATTAYRYDNVGNQIEIIDARGVELVTQDSIWAMEQRQQLGFAQYSSDLSLADITALEALYTSHQEFDAANRKTAFVDALGGRTQTDYDDLGNIVKTIDPNGNEGYFYYDDLSRLTHQIDPLGYVSETRYDELGNVTDVIVYATPLTTNYNENSDIASLILTISNASLDQVTHTNYNDQGQAVEVIDAQGNNEFYSYDSFGNIISYTDKNGNVFTNSYDDRNQLISTLSPQVWVTTDVENNTRQQTQLETIYQYDAFGNQTHVTTAANIPGHEATTETVYDKRNQAVQQMGPEITVYNPQTDQSTTHRAVTTVEYDASGNVIKQIDANGNSSFYYYNALNQQSSSVDALGALTQYSYDKAGNVILQQAYDDLLLTSSLTTYSAPAPVDSESVRETHLVYDANNLVLQQSTGVVDLYDHQHGGYSYGQATTHFQYDANGNLVKQTDGNGNSTYSLFDKVGNQIASVDGLGYLTAYSYDQNGNRTEEYRYAAQGTNANNLTTAQAGERVSASYTESSLLTALSITAGNDDRITQYSYDQRNQLTEERVLNVQLADVDNAGALTQVTADKVTTFFYDNNGNRTQDSVFAQTGNTTIGQIQTTDVAYDALGRQVSETSPEFTAEIDAVNHTTGLVRATTSYHYDARGNQVAIIEEDYNSNVGTIDTGDRVTKHLFDKAGNKVKDIDGLGYAINYGVDANGNVLYQSFTQTDYDNTQVWDNRTDFVYDALNRVIEQKGPEGVSQGTQYSAHGDIIGQGQWTTGSVETYQTYYEYDAAGRLAYTNEGNGTPRRYAYDKAGNVTLEAHSAGSVLPGLEYGLDVVLAQSGQVNIFFNEYNARNELIKVTQPTITQNELTAGISEEIATTELYSVGSVGVKNKVDLDVTQFIKTSAQAYPYDKYRIGKSGRAKERVFSLILNTEVKLNWNKFNDNEGARLKVNHDATLGEAYRQGHRHGTHGYDHIDMHSASNIFKHRKVYLKQEETADLSTGRIDLESSNIKSIAPKYHVWQTSGRFGGGYSSQAYVNGGTRGFAPNTYSLEVAVETGKDTNEWNTVHRSNGDYDDHSRFYYLRRVIGTAHRHYEINNTITVREAQFEIADQPTEAFSMDITIGDETYTLPKLADGKFGFAIGEDETAPFYLESGMTHSYEYIARDSLGNAVNGGMGTITLSDNYTTISSTHVNILSQENTVYNLVLSAPTQIETTIAKQQSYNAFGQIVSETDGNGNVTELGYNTLGQLTNKIDPEVDIWDEAAVTNNVATVGRPETTYHYNAHENVIGVTNARNFTTTQLVENGLSLQEFDAADGVKDKVYNIFGDLVAESRTHTTSENPVWTRYQYDAKGQLTQIDRPNTAVETFDYDELGNRISHSKDFGSLTGANLNQTNNATETYRYDLSGRISEYTSFAGLTTRYNYTYLSNLQSGLSDIPLDSEFNPMVAAVGGYEVTTTRADGKTLVDRKDTWGRNHYHRDLGDHQFYYQYNQAGWLSRQKGDTLGFNSQSQDIEYSYYANGLVRQINDLGSNRVTYYEYDANGNQVLEGITDIADSEIATRQEYYQVTRAEYDALNRITKLTDPRYVTEYKYDANSNRININAQYDYFLNAQIGQNVQLPLPEEQDFWYKYDELDRFTVTMGTREGGQVVKGTTGYEISYYADSNRATSLREYGADEQLFAGQEVMETYAYTDNGQLAQTVIEGRAAGSTGSYSQLNKVTRTVNLAGQTIRQLDLGATNNVLSETWYTYNEDSLKLREDLKNQEGTNKVDSTTYEYFNNTNELKKTLHSKYRDNVVNQNVTETTTQYSYVYWDSAKQSHVTTDLDFNDVTNTQQNPETGHAYYRYDANGHLVQLEDIYGERFLKYVVDQQGKVLSRNEFHTNLYNDVKYSHNYYYFAGRGVGDVGDDNAVARDYAQILAARQQSLNGEALRPVTSADFDQNFQPIGPDYPGNTPGSFTIAYDGQTLEEVASTVWGDSSLWYLIADANGLSSTDVLLAGTVLNIPNVVTNIHNNSNVFRPYNPGQAIGNTSPTLPEAPAPFLHNISKSKSALRADIRTLENLKRASLLDKQGEQALQQLKDQLRALKKGGGCGGAAIIIAIVAVVVTAGAAGVLAGAAGAAGATVGSTVAAGFSALAGGVASFGFGSAFIAGAIGTFAGQVTGNLLGVQDGFDFGSIATGGLSAGVGLGIGKAFKAGGLLSGIGKDATTFGAVARAGITNAVGSQAVNIVTGQQRGFNWRSFAAASIAGGINHNLGLNKPFEARSLDTVSNTASYLGRQVASGAIRQGIGVLVKERNSIDWSGIAGNAIGNTIVTGASGRFNIPEIPEGLRGLYYAEDIWLNLINKADNANQISRADVQNFANRPDFREFSSSVNVISALNAVESGLRIRDDQQGGALSLIEEQTTGNNANFYDTRPQTIILDALGEGFQYLKGVDETTLTIATVAVDALLGGPAKALFNEVGSRVFDNLLGEQLGDALNYASRKTIEFLYSDPAEAEKIFTDSSDYKEEGAQLGLTFALGGILGKGPDDFIRDIKTRNIINNKADVQSLNGKYARRTDISYNTADNVNSTFPSGWQLPYKPGTRVTEFKTTVNDIYVRAHGEHNKARSWIIKREAIEGLSAQQIKSKYSLPELPTHISEVHVPAGTRVRTGVVNPLPAFDGVGNSIQYELLQRLPESSFKNTVRIGQ